MTFDGVNPSQSVGYTNPIGSGHATSRAKMEKHELLSKVKEGLGVHAVNRHADHDEHGQGKKRHHDEPNASQGPPELSPELLEALGKVLGMTLSPSIHYLLLLDEAQNIISLVDAATQQTIRTMSPELLMSVLMSITQESGALTDRSI